MRIIIPREWILNKAALEEGQNIDTGPPPLSSWTIFFNSLDAPGRYVVRRFFGPVPSDEAHLENDLEGARSHVPEGLFCLLRSPNDHPSVVETWL